MTVDRIEKLKLQTAHAGLDAVAVIPGPNLIYLTGLSFHLSERPVVAFFPVEGAPVLLAPALEETKARSVSFGQQLFTYTDTEGPTSAFAQVLRTLGLAGKRLGIEGRRMRFLELDLMAGGGYAPQPVNADAVIAALRMRKNADEIALMRRAAGIAEQALQATLPFVHPGRTEKEIAAELTVQTLRAGSDAELPFTPLVASGANGANPHGFPTERKLQSGDLVTIDWGAAAGRYLADITRTYVVGGADVHPELRRAYAAVQAANAAGRAAAAPGATGQDVDRAARKVILDAGLGEYFIHRTGHGLGLEGHEEPDMKEGATMPLEPGMTFTVEPGVYIPGIGGVRIEDDIVITKDGAESLTTLPRDFEIIGA
ncbi:MAG: M24 family metallopeptidase [Anaerolineales bacterium]